MRPPLFLVTRFQEDTNGFRLWLPIFLVWLLVAVLLLALSPLIIVVLLALWPTGWGRLGLEIIKTAGIVMCELRGLKVDVRSRYQTVYINFV